MKQHKNLPLELDVETLKTVMQHDDVRWQIYEAAKLYANMGFYLLPIRPNQKILPPKSYNVRYENASRNKKIIDKWYNPDDGVFSGWNIGIATGRDNGVFVVDCDRHDDGGDGFVTLDKLAKDGKTLPEGPIQITPNDGKHHLLLWQPNLINSTDKLGPGIDTRGGIVNACKGHIVVFPSTVEGKRYEWSHAGEVPITPRWLVEAMGVAWRPPEKGGRGNEGMDDEDVERQIPLTQVANMLKYIDPNDMSYDEWVRVGQAINSQHPTEEGLDTWNEWSQEGNRYKPGECAVRWNGFNPGGPVRMGSLFFYAKEGGWVPEEGEVKSGNKYDVLTEAMNQEYAIIAAGGKIRVLRERDARNDPLGGSYDLLTVNDFHHLMSNQIVEVQNKRVPISKIWLASEARRTYESGIGLFPNGNPPSGYYNTWSGFAVDPIQGDCAPMIDHITEAICDGDREIATWMIDWLADAIQDPEHPKGCALVMRGQEGTGKGTLASLFGELYGVHYRHLIDDSHLLSNFNAHMMDAIVCFADEITWGGNIKTAGKLKGMVTETQLVGERKGMDVITYRNMIHMIIASNSDWVVPAGTQSRRWCVVDVNDEHARDPAYFEPIYEWIENGGREAFLHFLMNRKITSNLRSAPETEALQKQRFQAITKRTNPLLFWWHAILMKRAHDFEPMETFSGEDSDWARIVTIRSVYINYTEWCEARNDDPVFIQHFGVLVKEFGLLKCERKRAGKKFKCYNLPTIEDADSILEEKFFLDES